MKTTYVKQTPKINLSGGKKFLGSVRKYFFWFFIFMLVLEVGTQCIEDKSLLPIGNKLLSADYELKVSVEEALNTPDLSGIVKLFYFYKVYSCLLIYFFWFKAIKFFTVDLWINGSEGKVSKFVIVGIITICLLQLSSVVWGVQQGDVEIRWFKFEGLVLFFKNINFFLSAIKPLAPMINETVINQSASYIS